MNSFRGAEIFKEIIYHKVEIEYENETKTLSKLKDNIERIRQHHGIKSQEPQDYYEAIRSGDYFMFDDEYELNEMLDEHDQEQKPDINKNIKIKKTDSKSLHFSDKSTPSSYEENASSIESNNEDNINLIESNTNMLFKLENKNVLKIILTIRKYFIISIDFIINYLNKCSKDFRHVSHILTKEKLILKKKFGNIQTPNIVALVSTTINLNEQQKIQQAELNKFLQDKNDRMTILAAADEVDFSINSQNRFNKFFVSILYFMLSQTDKICYFFMILNNLQSASLLSVPLPISIFLWAMLCIPRPTKTYWITCISYIEVVVIIKYIFQFKFYPWSQNIIMDQDRTITLLGIERKDGNFALFDLFVLLVIFGHRLTLKVTTY
jgi:hypothetical protein